MSDGIHILKGRIHGRTISLDQDSGYPDGQAVSITLIPQSHSSEPLHSAFGAWSEDAAELDAFLDQIRLDRKLPRSEPQP